jgi:RNA polymerase sigma-70 factor (ECF subfamily)
MSARPARAGGVERVEGVVEGLGKRPANDCAQAAPAGRAERTEALYRQHRGVILRHCQRLLRDRAAAEDATHETFVRVTRHIDSAPPGEQALCWLYRIATNFCLNEIRNRRTAAVPTADVGALLDAGVEAAASPEDAASDRELVQRLLQSIPEKLRVVAVLRHVEGLYDAEVAAELGVARRTVVYRLKEFKRSAARRAR